MCVCIIYIYIIPDSGNDHGFPTDGPDAWTLLT